MVYDSKLKFLIFLNIFYSVLAWKSTYKNVVVFLKLILNGTTYRCDIHMEAIQWNVSLRKDSFLKTRDLNY